MAPQRGEKRTLTPEAFGQFLRWLSKDDELAVQEYQRIRTKLIRFFIHKGCTDADDLFDKTVDIVVAKVESGEEYHNPLAYCYGVARNVWHEDTRERKSVPLEVDVASPEHPDARPHEQELQCLDRCLARLSPGDNQVDVKARTETGDVFFEVSMTDAWVWDMYRPARFAKNVKVLTFKDVNVEELSQQEIDPPKA